MIGNLTLTIELDAELKITLDATAADMRLLIALEASVAKHQAEVRRGFTEAVYASRLRHRTMAVELVGWERYKRMVEQRIREGTYFS